MSSKKSIAPVSVEVIASKDLENEKISLDSIPAHMRPSALKYDYNNDGTISREELFSLMEDHMKTKAFNELFKKLLVALVIMMVLMVGSLTAMTTVSIQRSKDTTVEKAVLIDKTTGDQIQCANTDLIVVDGKLVSRSSASSGRRLLEDAGVLSTAQFSYESSLSDSLSPSFLDGTQSVILDNSVVGSRLMVSVHGVEKRASEASSSGVLYMYTQLGALVVEGDVVSYETDVSGAFARLGLLAYETSAARKLEEMSSSTVATKTRKLAVPKPRPPIIRSLVR